MYSIQSTLIKVKVSYPALVKRGLYTNAQQLLLGIGPVLDEEIDFVYAQNLFLQSMIDRQFQPTAAQINDLRDISLQTQPLNGYARAVLHWFTDERADVNFNLPFALPRSSQVATGDRANSAHTSLESKLELTIFPNPLQTGSSFTLANLPKGEHQIDVFDITGQKAFTSSISTASNTVQVNLREGLYFLSIPSLNVTKKLYIHE